MNPEQAAGDRVGAVVVTFFPDLALLSTLLSTVCGQVACCIVVDNTIDSRESDLIENIVREKGADYLRPGLNLGLGGAHNRGIDWAKENCCTHVLLLDQDSIPTGGMVETLLRELVTLQRSGVRVSAVGPRYIDPRSGHSSFFLQLCWRGPRRVFCDDGEHVSPVPLDFLISAGSLIPLQALDDVGPMDEGLFIDHVDTEWYLRAKAAGYEAFGICSAIMTHSLGKDTLRVWWGRWRFLPTHTPLRHYYIFRNSLLLYRRHYAPMRWILFDVRRLLLMLVFYTVAAAPRWSRFRMMLLGLWHGFQGRRGSFDSACRWSG